MSTESTPNFDTMSDEDFMNQTMAPPMPAFDPKAMEEDEDGAALEHVLDERAQGEVTPPAAATQDDDELDDVAREAQAQGGTTPADPEDDPAAQPVEDGVQPPADGAAADPQVPGHTTPHQTEAPGEAAPAEAPNYEELYKAVMAPFKANGRQFAPTSPEEAVKLMQMGANYTRKMQHLKPNLKLLRMLENNGLLEESKINFLIDLEKKNPQAIQKLLHDGKVDPMDLDPSVAPTYQPGNHGVSDGEMDFVETLENVRATPTGQATIRLINESFDHVSKKAVYAEPNLLHILDTQRQNGIFDVISAEIERRKILGEFGNVPFLHAYKAVGDELHSQGKLAPVSGSVVATPTPAAPAQPVVVDTRSARARKPAATRDQVRAVSAAPGTSSKPARTSFDPLTMSDAEIMAMPAPF